MQLSERFPAGLLVVCLFAALCGCSPPFNWREVRFDGAGLKALLPCKPDHGTRVVPLAGQTLQMEMQGCESNDATFAIARVDMKDPTQASNVREQWKAVTLANTRAGELTQVPLKINGAQLLSDAFVRASAKKADGSGAVLYAAWFAHEGNVFQALVVGDDIGAEAADAFFTGLQFQ